MELNTPFTLEKASTQYSDWEGTVALDDPQEELDHEVLGIDRRYHIIAVTVHHEWDSFDHVSAFVIDEDAFKGGKTIADLIAENDGVLPVIELQDIPTNASEIIRRFKRFDMVIQRQHTDVSQIKVIEERSLSTEPKYEA